MMLDRPEILRYDESLFSGRKACPELSYRATLIFPGHINKQANVCGSGLLNTNFPMLAPEIGRGIDLAAVQWAVDPVGHDGNAGGS
jgi:hypothetical protein